MRVMDGAYAIVRLGSCCAWPEWLPEKGFCSVTRTDDEISIVCEERAVPPGARAERGWGGIKIEGPLDFSLVGILASVATPLADAGVSIFAVSTFDTDYVLVKREELGRTVAQLERAGHRFGAAR